MKLTAISVYRQRNPCSDEISQVGGLIMPCTRPSTSFEEEDPCADQNSSRVGRFRRRSQKGANDQDCDDEFYAQYQKECEMMTAPSTAPKTEDDEVNQTEAEA